MCAPDPGPVWHWILGALFWPLVLALLLVAGAAWGQCWHREHVSAYLRTEHGLSLRSWGLSDAGTMLELFERDDGHFAVVETTPSGCTSILAFPHHLHGRLWQPPELNPIRPRGRRYEPGEDG